MDLENDPFMTKAHATAPGPVDRGAGPARSAPVAAPPPMRPLGATSKHRTGLAGGVLLVLGPLLFFGATECLGLLLPSRPVESLLCMVLLGFFAIVPLLVHWRQQHAPGARVGTGSYYRTLGLVSATAFLCGAAIAFAAAASFFGPLQTLQWAPAYANVLPSGSARAYADAARLQFAPGSRVDSARAASFQQGGTRHCAAPVVDDFSGAQVQFWAVGENCCAPRGAFWCDDAFVAGARGAVVVSGDQDSLAAVNIAAAQYELSTAPDALLVRWVTSVQVVEADLWKGGAMLLLVATATWLLAGVVVALVV